MITYEITPSSSCVIVDKVLDIRPIVYKDDGSYAMPDNIESCHFARQIGIVSDGERAAVFLQPRGVYIPDFGYGPITGRIAVRETQIELEGDYERFPALPRYKEIFTREILKDGMPYVSKKVFDTLNSRVQVGALTDKALDELIRDPTFCRALATVFKKVRFEIGFSMPPKQARAARRPSPAEARQECNVNV